MDAESQAVRAMHAEGVRGPGLAAVPAAVDLAAVGGAGHQPWAVLIEGEGEHRVRRLDTHVDTGPGVAAVAAGQQQGHEQ